MNNAGEGLGVASWARFFLLVSHDSEVVIVK